jgi:hypothetical protein
MIDEDIKSKEQEYLNKWTRINKNASVFDMENTFLSKWLIKRDEQAQQPQGITIRDRILAQQERWKSNVPDIKSMIQKPIPQDAVRLPLGGYTPNPIDVIKNFGGGAYEFGTKMIPEMVGLNPLMASQRITKELLPPRPPGIEGVGTPPKSGYAKSALETGYGLGMFMPELIKGAIKDPYKTLKEKPFDIALALGVGGVAKSGLKRAGRKLFKEKPSEAQRLSVQETKQPRDTIEYIDLKKEKSHGAEHKEGWSPEDSLRMEFNDAYGYNLKSGRVQKLLNTGAIDQALKNKDLAVLWENKETQKRTIQYEKDYLPEGKKRFINEAVNRFKETEIKPSEIQPSYDKILSDLQQRGAKVKVKKTEYKYAGLPLREEYNKIKENILKGNVGIAKTETPKGGIVHWKKPRSKKLKGKTEVAYDYEIKPMFSAPDIPGGRSLGQVAKGFVTAIHVFERMPKPIQDIYYRVRNGEMGYFRELSGIKQKILPKWEKMATDSGVKIKNISKRIATYLTGMQKGGMQILEAMGEKMPKLTETEHRIITEARHLFDQWFDKINKAREKAGQKPLKYEENYFPWIRNFEALKQAGMDIIHDPVSTIHAKLTTPGFKYAIRRKRYKGEIIDVPISLDFFKEFTNYADAATRFINVAPGITKLRTLLETMEIPTGELTKRGNKKMMNWNFKRDHPNAHEWLESWADRVLGKSEVNVKSWTKPFHRLAKKLNKNLAIAILSYNIRSALVQPTALRGAFTELGPTYLAIGIQKAFTRGEWERARVMSKVLDNRNFDIHATKAMEEGMSKYGSLKRKVGEAGIKYSLQALDQWTATATWLGAHEWATKKLKLKGEEAVRWADDIVIKTQASGKLHDISAIQGTPMGRLATLFQTFVIGENNWILHDVFGINNPKQHWKTTAGKTAKLVLSTAAINALFEGVLKIRSPFPSPEWELKTLLEKDEEADVFDILKTIGKEVSEQVPVIGGTFRWSTPYRTAWPAALQVGEEGFKVLSKILNFQIKDLTRYDIAAVGKIFGIPGTSQILKFINRLKRGMSIPKALIGVRTDLPSKKDDVIVKKYRKRPTTGTVPKYH